MTKENRNSLLNILSTLKELSYDSFLMNKIKCSQPYLAKSLDISVQCVQEASDHPELKDKDVLSIIDNQNQFISIIKEIRNSLLELYPSEYKLCTVNWNSLISTNSTVH